ncbi:MAG: BNR-4 repeat-containing protein [Planctomycetota bacterium]
MTRSLERIIIVMVVVLASVGEASSGAEVGRGASVERSSALRVLSERGCGRATAYSEFNKIVTIGDKTHVSWLDSENGKFLVKIQTLDRETGKWSAVYTVGEAYDNHGGPSLTSDSSGYLHIVYYPHHHPFRYRRSVRANDASQWTEEVQFGKKCTYSSMVCTADDKLVLVCRESRTRQWVLNLYEKPANGVWKGPRTILHGNAPSGYTRWQAALVLGRDGKTLHMSFMLFERALTEVGYAIGYLRSPDAGKSWQRSDGEGITLPATPATIEIVAGSATVEGPTNFRPGNIALDPDGVPWVIYSRMDREPFEAWVARLTAEGKWQKIPLLPVIERKWKGRGVKTPGSIVFGRDGTMYVVVTTARSGTGDELAFWGHPSAEVALLVSKDHGRTFSLFEVSSTDDSAANWLPNLERPTRSEPIKVPVLIYTHGPRGKTNKDIMNNEVVFCDVDSLLTRARP